MTNDQISLARKTPGVYACLLCGYTGPLAVGPDGTPVCQACQLGNPAYLLPACPHCGAPLHRGEASGDFSGNQHGLCSVCAALPAP